MKSKNINQLVLAGVLCGIGIVVPMLMPKIVIGPMSFTLASHVAIFIVNFPYARKEGIGHMFTKYAKPFYTYIAFAVCAGIIAACGLQYLAVAGICFTVSARLS